MKNKSEAHDCAVEGVEGRNTGLFQRHHHLLPPAIYYKRFSIPASNMMCQAEKEANHCGVLLCLLLVASSGCAKPPILSPNIELQHRGNCLLLSGEWQSPHQ